MTGGVFIAMGLAAAFGCSGDKVSNDKYIPDNSLVAPISRNMNNPNYSEGVKFVKSSLKSDFSFKSDVTPGFSFNPFNVALKSDFNENGIIKYKVGEDDFQYSLGAGFSDHNVVDYFEGFKISRGALLREGEKVLKGGNIKDFNVSGMTLEELAGLRDKFDEFSAIKKGSGFWEYDVALNATANARGMIRIEDRFSLSNDSNLKISHGFFGSVDAYGHSGFGANWNKNDLSANANSSLYYSYGLISKHGLFFEAKKESNNGNFIGIGIIKTRGDKDSFSGEYFANVKVNASSLDAGFEFGRREVREKIDSDGCLNYLTVGTDHNDTWFSSTLGFNRDEKIGTRETKIKGKYINASLDGIKKGDLDSHILENINDVSSSAVVNFVAGKEIGVNFFDIAVHGYFSNYPDSVSGLGGSVRSDLVNIMSSGNYSFGTVKLIGKGGSFRDNFKERAEDHASFLPGYMRESLWKGKNGFYIFSEKDNDREKVGVAIGFNNGLCLVGGSIKRNRKDGYFIEAGGENVNIKASYLQDDISGGDEASVGVDYSVSNGVSIGGGGSISDNETTGFIKVNFSI